MFYHTKEYREYRKALWFVTIYGTAQDIFWWKGWSSFKAWLIVASAVSILVITWQVAIRL